MLGFKPQPLNYSAQAEAALRMLAPRAVDNWSQDEADVMLWLADKIKDAIHFIVPEDGKIFDDKFRGIQGSEIHLPFPLITIEYRATQDPGVSVDGDPLYKASRRVLVAMEMSGEDLVSLARRIFLKGGSLPRKYTNQLLDAFPNGVILVTGVFFLEYEVPLWSPPYAGWLFPTKGWDEFSESNVIAPLRKLEPGDNLGITGRPFPLFWRSWLEMDERLGREMANRYIVNDIGVESFVVLELIEALSCSNVRTETLQYVKPNVNARRIRDGKLPLYETKILTVHTAPKKPGLPHGPLADARASPGEHLRMGHIQSYNTREGKVNLWKQAITVSAGNPRAIKKSYKVKK